MLALKMFSPNKSILNVFPMFQFDCGTNYVIAGLYLSLSEENRQKCGLLLMTIKNMNANDRLKRLTESSHKCIINWRKSNSMFIQIVVSKNTNKIFWKLFIAIRNLAKITPMIVSELWVRLCHCFEQRIVTLNSRTEKLSLEVCETWVDVQSSSPLT